MNDGKISVVDITIGANMYGRISDITNTPSHVLAEFVDNAIQSYKDKKAELQSQDSNYKLRVDISFEWDPEDDNRASKITIIDNAGGIGEDKFVEACEKVIAANKDFVPPYGTGASLYLRPYMFGSNPVIGVKPADEYEFRILVTPVGPYFKGGAKPITIKVSDFDRAAPHGTGHIKAGLNYAMSLHAIQTAHREGFAENMYLDPETRTKVEETGGANFIFVTKDGTLVTPKSDSILPSITRRSICYVAEKYLGMKVEHREVYFDEVKDFAECGLCGTAAVVSPVGKINDHGKEICFPAGMEEMGPWTKKIYDTLTGIQRCEIEAPEGWIKVIK